MPNLFTRSVQRVIDAAWALRYGKPDTTTRSFSGAQTGRLFSDWVGAVGPMDVYLRRDLVALRSNSRRLAMNNDYMKSFLRMVRRNVIGPSGIVLQNRAKDDNGKLDKEANDLIEQKWADWGQRGTCTVCGQYSWLQVQWMVATLIARDGEVIVRKVRGFPNKFGFAVQLFSADHLDETLNTELPGGGDIRMGVERDQWKRPVALHLKVKASDRQYARHQRIPISEIEHLYVPEDFEQTRGLPWAHSAIRRLGMLGGYEEAALVAARAGAAKMGFFQQREGAGSYTPDETDEKGDFIDKAEPGSIEILPEGFEFKEFDPSYPNGEMPFFMKSVLRGAAAGLGVSYNGLANDLEGVNFSSIRAGLQDERDEWMVLQQFIIQGLVLPVFSAWLEQAMLKKAVPLPFSKIDKLMSPQWFPRRWKWVDPDKDSKTAERDISLGVQSRTRLAAEQGRDLREVYEELAAEEQLAKDLGVTLGASKGSVISEEKEEEDAAGDK